MTRDIVPEPDSDRLADRFDARQAAPEHFLEAFRLRGEMILEAGRELERLRRRIQELERGR